MTQGALLDAIPDSGPSCSQPFLIGLLLSRLSGGESCNEAEALVDVQRGVGVYRIRTVSQLDVVCDGGVFAASDDDDWRQSSRDLNSNLISKVRRTLCAIWEAGRGDSSTKLLDVSLAYTAD